uniref:COX8A oxidase n=1 Tax=Nothoprocta perdicaria TaxID=30464 RepID=A0A8C6YQW1_NOTPE
AMGPLQRVPGLLAAALRRQRPPRAPISSMPPEEPLSGEQAIALSVMFASFLIPSAWVLANLEHYKSRPE